MSQDALLKEVERIRPILVGDRDRAEAERSLTDAAYDAMIDAGLYRAYAPKAFGGLELHPVETLRMVEAVSRIDSAAGWNLNMSGNIAGFLSWLAPAGAEEIFARGPDTLFAGGFFPPGPSVRVDGGWRITARQAFATGCRRAHWFAVPMREVDDFETRFDPWREDPPPIVAFVPRDEVDLIDTWHTVGMRGTGSADVSVDDVFVPDDRVAFIDGNAERPPAFSGPLYGTVPWLGVHGETMVALGIAAAAIEELLDLVMRKTPSFSRTQLRDREMAQHHAAKATALVEAADASLGASISEAYADAEAGSRLSEAAMLRCQRAACFGSEAAAEAVDLVHEASGSTAIRQEHGIERHHRDVHVLTQHTTKNYARYEDVGKMLFGLPPTLWILRI